MDLLSESLSPKVKSARAITRTEHIRGAGSLSSTGKQKAWHNPADGRTEQDVRAQPSAACSPNLMQFHNLIGDYHKDQGQTAQEPCQQGYVL